MSLCPFKFRLQGFEGGENCDHDCMWFDGDECAVKSIADSLIILAGMKLMDAKARGVAEND